MSMYAGPEGTLNLLLQASVLSTERRRVSGKGFPPQEATLGRNSVWELRPLTWKPSRFARETLRNEDRHSARAQSPPLLLK